MKKNDIEKLRKFFSQTDDAGVTNAQKAGGSACEAENCPGVVRDENDCFVGFGINIKNKSVYPIEKFELLLRDKNLAGELDLSGCADLVFLDVYRNAISSVNVTGQTSMRILGLQDNRISSLEVGTLSACQGIDVGKNRLTSLDVSKNSELVELYVHFNELCSIDLSKNQKLKYFWCNGNHITSLDTTANPLLRHLDCRDNPLTSIRALAPQKEALLPLRLSSAGEGFVGLKFCPVYTPQWKETGEWQQSYFAYPKEGHSFAGWFDESGEKLSSEPVWVDTYGESRVLTARFE